MLPLICPIALHVTWGTGGDACNDTWRAHPHLGRPGRPGPGHSEARQGDRDRRIGPTGGPGAVDPCVICGVLHAARGRSPIWMIPVYPTW